MENKKRIEWLDLARALAIILVALCHAVEGTYNLKPDYMATVQPLSRLFCFGAFTFGRMGVPLFLMITGYLLLDRDYSDQTVKKFWKTNWLNLLICTEFWFIVYEFFNKYYMKTDVSLLSSIEDLLFLRNINLGHAWYMPMIIGMYILIPFAAKAINGFETKSLKFPFLFFAAFSFIPPLIGVINTTLKGDALSTQLSLGFSGGAYGIYIVSGYLVKKGVFKKCGKIALGYAILISFVLAVLIQLWAFENNNSYRIRYDSPFIFIAGLCLFELFSRIKKVPAYRLLHAVSKFSLGMYFIHFPIRMVMIKVLKSYLMPQPFKVFIIWAVSFVLSFIISVIISKIPKVGKRIVNVK